MTKKREIIILINFFYFVVSIVPFFLSHNQVINYSPYNYFIVQLIIVLILLLYNKEDRFTLLLSPSFIAVSYINLNFFLGSLAFMGGQVDLTKLSHYRDWDNLNIIAGYFNLINYVIFNAFLVARRTKFIKIKLSYNLQYANYKTLLILGLTIIFIFSVIQVSIGFLGGAGSFSIIPKSIGAIILFALIIRINNPLSRALCYIGIILIFALDAENDKRDAIFLLLPVLLIESTKFNLTFNFKKLAIFFVSLTAILYLIITLSILRGYGEYKPKGFLNATSYIGEYIKSDWFVPAFMNNIEVSYTYLHSNQSVQYILNNHNQLAWGETLIKPLFIPIPRSVFPSKPQSVIDLYTKTFSKEFREIGGSYPISLQSELFWNFHFAGVIIGFTIFYFLNSFYLTMYHQIRNGNIVNMAAYIYGYETLLTLFRGSGFDLYFIYVLFGFGFFVFLKLFLASIISKQEIK